MLIPLITSAIVAVVKGTWIASSILLKYFIMGVLGKNLYDDSLTWVNVKKDILESSEIVVSIFVVCGIVLAATGLDPSPMVKLFSEFIALAYFAFLFWKY